LEIVVGIWGVGRSRRERQLKSTLQLVVLRIKVDLLGENAYPAGETRTSRGVPVLGERHS